MAHREKEQLDPLPSMMPLSPYVLSDPECGSRRTVASEIAHRRQLMVVAVQSGCYLSYSTPGRWHRRLVDRNTASTSKAQRPLQQPHLRPGGFPWLALVLDDFSTTVADSAGGGNRTDS